MHILNPLYVTLFTYLARYNNWDGFLDLKDYSHSARQGFQPPSLLILTHPDISLLKGHPRMKEA